MCDAFVRTGVNIHRYHVPFHAPSWIALSAWGRDHLCEQIFIPLLTSINSKELLALLLSILFVERVSETKHRRRLSAHDNICICWIGRIVRYGWWSEHYQMYEVWRNEMSCFRRDWERKATVSGITHFSDHDDIWILTLAALMAATKFRISANFTFD